MFGLLWASSVTSNNSSTCLGTSLEVQWLELHASPAGGTGSILGQGTGMLQA